MSEALGYLSTITNVFVNGVEAIIAFGIFALAFWQNNIFLYIVAVPAGMVFGLLLADGSTIGSSMWVSGVVVAVIATFCLYRAANMGFEAVMRRIRR